MAIINNWVELVFVIAWCIVIVMFMWFAVDHSRKMPYQWIKAPRWWLASRISVLNVSTLHYLCIYVCWELCMFVDWLIVRISVPQPRNMSIQWNNLLESSVLNAFQSDPVNKDILFFMILIVISGEFKMWEIECVVMANLFNWNWWVKRVSNSNNSLGHISNSKKKINISAEFSSNKISQR